MNLQRLLNKVAKRVRELQQQKQIVPELLIILTKKDGDIIEPPIKHAVTGAGGAMGFLSVPESISDSELEEKIFGWHEMEAER